MKNLKKYLKGFTLVELIIVITLLAILATIAFVSFQNYTKDARDSSRAETLSIIQKSLELFYIKSYIYPTPDNQIVFSGGNIQIQMGDIGQNTIKLLGLHTIPIDPLTHTTYKYATSGNNLYYQIAGEQENSEFSYIDSTYAINKSLFPIIKGNYFYDPNLPSLFLIKDSVTGSGIFGENVCFILNNGENNFSSDTSNCIKKKEISTQKYDSSLVGYWNMETLSGTYLKDISGNGNEAILTGGMIYTSVLTGGQVGKGVTFDGVTNFMYINNSTQTGHILKANNFTLFTQMKLTKDVTTWSNNDIIQTGRDWSDGGGYVLRISKGNNINVMVFTGPGNKCLNLSAGTILKDIFYTIVLKKENQVFKVFVNGELKNSVGIDSNMRYDSYPIYFGKDTTWGGSFFSGVIDEMKIYNRPLSDQEIIQQSKFSGL